LLARLLLLFTVVPLVELALLLWIGSLTGLRFTLLLVLLTGIIGAGLARHQGLRCWLRVQQQLSAGQLPADPLVDGLMILVAGALLVNARGADRLVRVRAAAAAVSTDSQAMVEPPFRGPHRCLFDATRLAAGERP